MTADNENRLPLSERRHFWAYRRLWSAIALLAVLVLWVRDNQPLLQTVKDADTALVNAIESVKAKALIAGFNARAGDCYYRWLVYCDDKPSRPECLQSADGCFHGPYSDSGYLSMIWRTVQTLAQLPDRTWYMIKKTWRDSYVSFGLLIVFIVLNVAVATRVPLIFWPISLPLTTMIASGLFWLVQQVLVLATGTVGVLIQLLLASVLIPNFIIAAFEYIRGANNLTDVVHKTAEVTDVLHSIEHLQSKPTIALAEQHARAEGVRELAHGWRPPPA
jgi:hypothetical protein